MKGCDVVKPFFSKNRFSENKCSQISPTSSPSNQTVLIKWCVIGFLGFLTVLFCFLQVSFTSSNQETEGLEDFSTAVVESDEPIFDFGDEEAELPELPQPEEELVKSRIWQALMTQDYQTAADVAYEAVHNNTLREDSDLLNWYQDVYTVANVKNIESSQQDVILSSFKTPRFQAVFPPFTSVLTLASIIEDDSSLLPIDVRSVQVLSEEWVDPKTCESVSPYIAEMTIHFKEIYKAKLLFNDEAVTAYVGIFNNGYLKLLGYYGESTSFKTDEYWESKRIDYAQNPNF